MWLTLPHITTTVHQVLWISLLLLLTIISISLFPNSSNYCPSYDVFDHLVGIDEYSTRDSAMTNQQSQRVTNTNIRPRNRDCPRSNHNSHEYQAIWQHTVDPDHMSYEELLELGETVGTQSRGLSHEQISLLPVSKFRCCFLRRKSQSERCVICQMEYKRGARLITLPCKHKYHVGCATKWLNINKACPICYTEVSLDVTKKFK
ncbi:E3 ubiquitin-protein ligase BIG BROTHER-like isoform X2 [Silene latifolia]|uniref:E3 ubiquitin-protein ligase BIG BROTHER-like isoform X2 n=1 Tax=Silene latifolia TaxID=37657 RepID=UPI003D77FB86